MVFVLSSLNTKLTANANSINILIEIFKKAQKQIGFTCVSYAHKKTVKQRKIRKPGLPLTSSF